MPGPLSRQRHGRPIQHEDRQGRLWWVSQIARGRLVSPAIDGPNVALVIRFEREGEERFAVWNGDAAGWRGRQALHRLFAESEAA